MMPGGTTIDWLIAGMAVLSALWAVWQWRQGRKLDRELRAKWRAELEADDQARRARRKSAICKAETRA